jgi:uncharacterized protein YegL
MRRLPVFFVLDCSESMVGEKLKKMEDGLQAIIQTLRTDPHALETVYLSIIAFAGTAKTITPLIEVPSFYPPKLPLGSGTSLGAALEALMAEIDRSVVKSTPEQKGDWKPIVYLFTDGHPTDDPKPAVSRWNGQYARKATLIAITLGKDADFTVLKQLTENVILFEETKEGDFRKFVNWVTASVVAQSRSVGEGMEGTPLPIILDESVMRIIKNPPPGADDSCVVLIGRCQKTRKPYIIKYERQVQAVAAQDFRIDVPSYHLSGCYPLEEDYFAWSDNRATEHKVSTTSLIGVPGCPHCGNVTAFAMCSCGKLLCVNGPGPAKCPWCGNECNFEGGGCEEFDVGRGRG